MILCNFHTHTDFADGVSTPEETVISAVSKGFHSLGFSEHSTSKDPRSFGMKGEAEAEYFRKIGELSEKYGGKITLLRGLELDSFGYKTEDYDYIIGSVHYLERGGEVFPIDLSEEAFCETVSALGGIERVIGSYFCAVAEMAKKIKPTIIGHFDLIAKFNEGGKYFDESFSEYLAAAESAIEEIMPFCSLFEINTGAISRGYRSAPYPSVGILRLLKKHGCDIIINSDSHSAESLDCAFGLAERLIRDCGFTRRCELGKDGIRFVNI